MKMWLTRDSDLNGDYCIYKEKPSTQRHYSITGSWLSALVTVTSDDFHKLTTIRLEPGGGPIEIDIIELK